MRKEQIVEMKQQKNILNEKKILDMMDHPFILKLAGHYHDNAEVTCCSSYPYAYAYAYPYPYPYPYP